MIVPDRAVSIVAFPASGGRSRPAGRHAQAAVVLDEALGAASPGSRRRKTLARWLEKPLQHSNFSHARTFAICHHV
jgi:hypothetical protein